MAQKQIDIDKHQEVEENIQCDNATAALVVVQESGLDVVGKKEVR